MKEYEVIIDFECFHTTIKAGSKEDAEEKALEEYRKLTEQDGEHPQYWVGECEEAIK